MSRLIDADAFADFIKNAIKAHKYDALKVNDTTLTVGDVLESVIVELEGTGIDGFKNNPTIVPQPEQRWIPVTERLPEESELILLCFRFAKDTPHWRVQVGYLGYHDVEDYDFQKIGVAQVWHTDRFYWSFDKVVAWMPLPEPYKDGGGALQS